MFEWILVLSIAWRDPGVTVVPWRFASEEQCQKAAKAWEARQTQGWYHRAACLPFPTAATDQR